MKNNLNTLDLNEADQPMTEPALSESSNDMTGETIADSQNESAAKKRNFKKISLIAGVLFCALLFFGYVLTRKSQKKQEVNLPAPTFQTSNTTGQLVDNLTSTPTPAVPVSNPANDPSQTNTANANTAVPNGNPRYAANSGLFQPNVPVTQQTQALNQQKNAAEMTDRGNNPKNIPPSVPVRGGGGGNYSGGGNFNLPENSQTQTVDPAVPTMINVESKNPDSSKRTKAVFYGKPTNSINSAKLSQVYQAPIVTGGQKNNFNNIPFGTLLPVRTIGAVHTLLQSALARLELTQTVKGEGWVLPAGTVIVGQVSQGIGNRVNITPRGFIMNDRFYQLQGEISGTDGGIGLLGDQKTIGGKWYRPLLQVADKLQQTFNTWLAGKGGGNITNIQIPTVAQVAEINPNQSVQYVAVKPNATGYLLITQLPSNQESFSDSGNSIQSLNAIPSSIQGLSVEDVNNILASGNEQAIQTILNRKPLK